MHRVRVLHVSGSMRFGGGIETWLMNLFRTYNRQRLQMDYCFTSESPGDMVDELERLGSEIVGCRWHFNYFDFSRRFAGLLRRKPYEVVHVHSNDFSGAVVRGAALADIPVRIAHYHSTGRGHSNDWKRRLYLFALRRWIDVYATHILGCSWGAIRAFWPQLCAAGDKRCQAFYYGINLGRFKDPVDAAAVRAEFGIPEGVPVIGHVGRFERVKNHPAFFKIGKKLLDVFPDTYFLLVGDGPLRKQVEQLSQEQGLRDRTVFAGHRKDIPRVLRAMDIFLFPSLWEGFGIVVVEAIAAGVPVVASDMPGLREAVLGEFKNLTFPVDNEDIAFKNVLELLQNPERGRKMIEGCKAELLQFDLDYCLERLEKFYLDSLSRT